MLSIWEEVKTRKIFKAATIYAAVTWGIIQIADVLFPVVGVPDWVMSSMVLLAFSGFPIALIIGWMLDIRLDRQKALEANKLLDDAENSELKPTPKIPSYSRYAELAVIALFGIGAAMLYYNSASEPAQASVDSKKQVNNQSVIQKTLISAVDQQKTIAVLPFVSFSDSNSDEIFADGLSEELLNVLARNKKLRVAARTSSFQYKKTNINVKTIAQELGVQYILEGSIRRSNDLIRVTAQLIKADENINIFSKSWDRNINNIFEVQDEISNSVLEELKVSLLGESNHKKSSGTKSIEAFALYSKGLNALGNRTGKDFKIAVDSFQQALKIDEQYVEAAIMLAETYLLQNNYRTAAYEEVITKAKPLIDKALKLKPELGTVHAVKGLFHWQIADEHGMKNFEERKKELELAKQHFSKAIELNPSHAEVHMWYGSILQNEGDFESGAKLRKKAFQLNPRGSIVGFNHAMDLIRYGDYKGAMTVFNTVVRNNPNYSNAYDIAGNVSYQAGQLDQAYSMFRRLAELGKDEKKWLVNSINVYIPVGEFELAQKNLDKILSQEGEQYKGWIEQLQVSNWLASDDVQSFYQWANSLEQDDRNWGNLIWRGYAYAKQQKWKLAEKDLDKALALMNENSPKNMFAIRVQLMLSRAYQVLGDQVKASFYIDVVTDRIKKLKQTGFTSHNVRYFEASLAALKGESETALSLLRQSVQEGFVQFWWAENDPIFDELIGTPQFQSIKDELSVRMSLMKTNIRAQHGDLNQNIFTSSSIN